MELLVAPGRTVTLRPIEELDVTLPQRAWVECQYPGALRPEGHVDDEGVLRLRARTVIEGVLRCVRLEPDGTVTLDEEVDF